MTRLRAILCAGLGIAAAACGDSAELRYKVTVEIDAGGTPRSGSAVWSRTLKEPTVALARPHDGEFVAEAVPVDLGNGRVLFALLRGEDGDEGTVQMWPEHLFRDVGPGLSDRIGSLRQIASRQGEIRELPRWRPAISSSREPTSQYPLLVRFADPATPETVEVVAPDALDRAFGPGVRLKRITVEITDEPVSTGVRTKLPWLEAVGRDRGTLIPDPPRRLADAQPVQLVKPSDFSTELYK